MMQPPWRFDLLPRELEVMPGQEWPGDMNFLDLLRKHVIEGGGLHKFLRTAVPAHFFVL